MNIVIIILTRDRLNYFKRALESVINQKTLKKYKIIVSDNSKSSETQNYVKAKFPNIEYIRRIPELSSDDHFRKAFLLGSISDYFVVFHDDDVMLPTYIDKMTDLLDKHSHIAAVGCNAQYINNKKLIQRYFLSGFQGIRFLSSQFEFINSYFRIGTQGYAPFPGYMYNSSYYNNEDVANFEVGKYSDITFLLKLLIRGPILWTTDVLMLYRVHKNNDSRVEEIRHRIRLLRYLYSKNIIKRNSSLSYDIRFRYWCSSVSTDIFNIKKNDFIAYKFIMGRAIKYILTNYKFSYEIYKKIIIKCKR